MLIPSLPFAWLPLWRIVSYRPIIIIGILRVTNLIYTSRAYPVPSRPMQFSYSYSTVANAFADDTLSQGLFVQHSAQMAKHERI